MFPQPKPTASREKTDRKRKHARMMMKEEDDSFSLCRTKRTHRPRGESGKKKKKNRSKSGIDQKMTIFIPFPETPHPFLSKEHHCRLAVAVKTDITRKKENKKNKTSKVYAQPSQRKKRGDKRRGYNTSFRCIRKSTTPDPRKQVQITPLKKRPCQRLCSKISCRAS